MPQPDIISAVLEIPEQLPQLYGEIDTKLASIETHVKSIVGTIGKGNSMGKYLSIQVDNKDALSKIAKVKDELDKLPDPKEIKIKVDKSKLAEALGDVKDMVSRISEMARSTKLLQLIEAAERTTVRNAGGGRRGSKKDPMSYDEGLRRFESLRLLDDSTYEDAKAKLKEINALMRKLAKDNGDGRFDSILAEMKVDADKLKGSLGTLKEEMTVVTNDAQFLLGAFKEAFSIAAVVRFGKQVVSVRGEFEMIQKSLDVLVRDSAKARKIFKQIQDIAIESPYEIKDLAQQTKQMSAYGIEVDKLVEKTKMLGDIASGTGVDINRLALAYGQIRAATVLKGTEARQLTEAGVDIYTGLSKYYSDLEGRMVSVSEIMDRQRKKLITFEDVDQVLQGMTSIGGRFYRMQEQQAQTIQGMISNLKDRASVAFNEIGSDYQGIIKMVIGLMQSVLANAKLIEFVMTSWGSAKLGAGIANAVVHIADGFGTLGKNFQKVKEADGFFKKLAASARFCTAPIGAVAAGLAAVTFVVLKLTKLGRDLNKIRKEATAEIAQETASYEALVAKINDTNRSVKDRTEALNSLKASYGNILDLEGIEITNLDLLNERYAENLNIIRNTIREKKKQEQIERAMSDIKYDEDKAAAGFAAKVNEGFDLAGYDFKASQKDVLEAMDAAIIAISNGTAADIDQAVEIMITHLLASFGEAADQLDVIKNNIMYDGTFFGRAQKMGSALKQYFDAYKTINKKNKRTIEVDASYSKGAFEAEMKTFVDTYNEWIKEHPVQISPEFLENAAAYDDPATKAVVDMYNALLKNLENSPMVDQLKKQCERDLKLALSQAGLHGYEKAVNEIWNKINAKHQESDAGFELGKGATAYNAETDSWEDYYKKIEKLIQTRDAISSQVYGKASVVDQATWEAFLGVYELSDKAAKGASVDELIKIAKERDAELQELLKSLPKPPGTLKKDAQKAKKTMKEFVNDLLEIADDWETLSAVSQKLTNEKIEIDAQKMGLNVEVPKFTDIQSIRDFVNELVKMGKMSREDQVEIELRLDKDKLERDIKKIKDEVDKAWDRYDFAKDMKDLGLSISGFNTDKELANIATLEQKLRQLSLSSEEIANNSSDANIIEENRNRSRAALDAADELKQKRLEIERKEREEALKIMAEAQEKSYAKAVQAARKTAEDVRKIQSVNSVGIEYDDNGKPTNMVSPELIKAETLARMQKGWNDIADAQWESYKSSEMYIAAFGDLEALGTEVVVKLRDQLQRYATESKEALNPTEARQLQKTIAEMDARIASSQGAKTYSGAFVEALETMHKIRTTYAKEADDAMQDWLKDNVAFENAKTKEADLYDQLSEKRRVVLDLEEQIRNAGTGDSLVEMMDRYNDAVRERDELEQDFQEATQNVVDAENKASTSLNKYTNATRKMKVESDKAIKRLNDIKGRFDQVSNAAFDAVNYTKEVAETFGIAFDDDTLEIMESFEQGFKLMGGALAIATSFMEIYKLKTIEATGATAALETLLWPLLLIAAAMGAIAAALKAADLAIKRNIEMHKAWLERLEKEYEKLEGAMESALALTDVGSTYEKQLQNLERQRAELEEIIRLEKSRKKPDKEAIKDYENDLDDIRKSAEDARRKMDEIMGKPTDYQSLAKSWASAWLDAFKETGDGLSALQDSFEDMFDDIVVGQLQNITVGPAAARFKEMVDNVLSDLVITKDEAEQLAVMKETLLKGLNEQNKSLMEAMGIGQTGTLETDTIQKGLQSLTEDTGVALESLANSMRAHLANMDANIAAFLGGGNGEMENPFIVQMRTQTELTRDIKNLLSDVIRPGGHEKGGAGIKVFTD